MLGNGAYNLSEAARLTGRRRDRVREWFRGRNAPAARSVFSGDYRTVRGQLAISFYAPVEVFIAGPLRDKGQDPRVCPKCKSPYWDRPRKASGEPGKKCEEGGKVKGRSGRPLEHGD